LCHIRLAENDVGAILLDDLYTHDHAPGSIRTAPPPRHLETAVSDPILFGAKRLLIVGTGSVNVALLPFWIQWLTAGYPDLETRVVVTRTAERFVSRAALTAMTHHEAVLDAWPDEPTLGARHVELAEWADAIAVYPATLHFLARYALGLADSPSLLALQCTTAPVVVAPALPPGGWQSPAVAGHVAALKQRRNVVVAPPRPGRSVTTGRDDAWAPVPFPTALRFLEACRTRLSSPEGD
jgi:phosphopantothenoylcysteine decarboxylase/phosphopantothenate--cysteine ligase